MGHSELAKAAFGVKVMRLLKVGAALAFVALLAGCAAGSAASHHAVAQGALYQLLLGLWHGIIAPVTLIVEIINRVAPRALPWHFHMYETNGATMPYDIGFYVGLVGGPWVGWTRRPWR
jgi:hypothetical protein